MTSKQPSFSRRDFLKVASLGAFSLGLPRRVTRLAAGAACPPPPRPTASGGLTPAQQLRLEAASRPFIAPDPSAARQVALEIDFIEGPNEDASTMCGPLAIAILQSAGLLGMWAQRHDFWLLNPRLSLLPVEETFPTDHYEWLIFEEPISTFDFSAQPLLPGDLVYLHAAPGDTFEHILVVTRVDEAGRAFTVSNFFTRDSTIIEERLLYDPQQLGTGQLANWGNRALRNQMGNTGKAGFRIWRVKDGRSLEFPNDLESQRLRADLDALLLSAAGDWYASITEVDGPLLYQFNPYASFHPASTIKVPIGLAFYHWLEAEEINDWTPYLNEHGIGGRSYTQLLQAMLVDSEEEATELLTDFLGKARLDELWLSWGLKATKIDPRRSSATDLGSIFESLLGGSWVSAQARTQLLDLLSTYSPSDETRLGLLRPRLPAGSTIYNKRGSLVDWPRVVADSGLIRLAEGEVYSFSLHGLGKDEAGYELLEATLDQAVAVFGNFLVAKTA